MCAGMSSLQSRHRAISVMVFGGMGLMWAMAGCFLLLHTGQINLCDGIFNLHNIVEEMM